MGVLDRGDRGAGQNIPFPSVSPWGSSSQAGKAAGPGRADGSDVWRRAQHRGSHKTGTQREVGSCPLRERKECWPPSPHETKHTLRGPSYAFKRSLGDR